MLVVVVFTWFFLLGVGSSSGSYIGCEQRKSVFFLALGHGYSAMSNSTLCAIRSACYLNPGLTVYVYGESDETKTALQWARARGCPNNLVYVALEEAQVLANSPLEALYNNTVRNLTTGPYYLNNRANALRLALLYQRGGGYLDTDMVSVRPLTQLPCEALGAQSVSFSESRNMTVASKMNTAAMVFNAQSTYLLKCMKHFVSDFQPYTWAHQGPHLVSRLYFRKYDAVESVKNVMVLRREVFYPVGMDTNKQVKPFFVKPASVEFRQNGFPEPTVGVHLWNKHSSEWLRLGREGKQGGWNIHPQSQAALILDACMADAPLPEPFFSRHNTATAETPFLCDPGVYCGK
jgi:hypothetical protein